MRVKYSDISQTFFQEFSFHVTVVFFFNRFEKIGILEFCCTSFRELLFTFFICVLFPQFAHWLPSVQSGSRGEKHSRFFQLRGISLHSGTPARANSEFPVKCLSFLQRKEPGNKKRRANQSDWVFAARRCVSRTVHERGGVRERMAKLFWRRKS